MAKDPKCAHLLLLLHLHLGLGVDGGHAEGHGGHDDNFVTPNASKIVSDLSSHISGLNAEGRGPWWSKEQRCRRKMCFLQKMLMFRHFGAIEIFADKRSIQG